VTTRNSSRSHIEPLTSSASFRLNRFQHWDLIGRPTDAIENHRATALPAEAEIFGLEFHPALPSPCRREGKRAPHNSGLMFWLGRNRLVESYLFSSATSRWYVSGPQAALTAMLAQPDPSLSEEDAKLPSTLMSALAP